MEDKPNYYAILPAKVRYDKELTDKEKLLYAEITALCNKEGICWAGNQYFADLYNVSTRTIIRSINNLVLKKYLNSKLIYKPNSKEVQKRILSITDMLIGGDKNVMGGGDKNVTDNNTSNEYIISERIATPPASKGKKSDFLPPTIEEVKKYIEEKKYNIDPVYFFEYYSADGWRDKNNKPIKNWKLKAFTWHKNNSKVSNPITETKTEPTIFDENFEVITREDYIHKMNEWRKSGRRNDK